MITSDREPFQWYKGFAQDGNLYAQLRRRIAKIVNMAIKEEPESEKPPREVMDLTNDEESEEERLAAARRRLTSQYLAGGF